MKGSTEEKDDLQMIIYSLQSLCFKGISIPDTISMSLAQLIQWYDVSKDRRYIDTAVLQLRALSEMGMLQDRDRELYRTVLNLAGWTEEEQLARKLFQDKKVRVNKSQVRAMIRKWMPSRSNPMTISEVVDDIIDKVKNHKEGRYYYRYERKRMRRCDTSDREDIYLLVVEANQSFFLDLKGLKCYTFQISNAKDEEWVC